MGSGQGPDKNDQVREIAGKIERARVHDRLNRQRRTFNTSKKEKGQWQS